MLYSQHDPQYDLVRLGKTSLTIGSHGCFIVSMANLYQKHPKDIMAIPGAVLQNADLVSGIVAEHYGGKAGKPTTKQPKGWSIAVTNDYSYIGYVTHFFCINGDMMIDPLEYPAKIEKCTYKIDHYRPFTGIKLGEEPDTPQTNSILLDRIIRAYKASWNAGTILKRRYRKLIKRLSGIL